jgi:hypothetical protein
MAERDFAETDHYPQESTTRNWMTCPMAILIHMRNLHCLGEKSPSLDQALHKTPSTLTRSLYIVFNFIGHANQSIILGSTVLFAEFFSVRGSCLNVISNNSHLFDQLVCGVTSDTVVSSCTVSLYGSSKRGSKGTVDASVK